MSEVDIWKAEEKRPQVYKHGSQRISLFVVFTYIYIIQQLFLLLSSSAVAFWFAAFGFLVYFAGLLSLRSRFSNASLITRHGGFICF